MPTPPPETSTLSLHDALPIFVTELVVPSQPAGTVGAYLKYAMRPLDFSIVGAGVRLVLGADGTCSDARIGLNGAADRSEEHTSELQSRRDLVCRLLLEKKK